jgi:hypothetical protein
MAGGNQGDRQPARWRSTVLNAMSDFLALQFLRRLAAKKAEILPTCIAATNFRKLSASLSVEQHPSSARQNTSSNVFAASSLAKEV